MSQFHNNFLNSKYNANYAGENATGLSQVKDEMNKKQELINQKENYFVNNGEFTPSLPVFVRLHERKTNDFCIYGVGVNIQT